MDLKGIYLQLEDKWYAALDKIDQHVPIYGVVDKIDAVVPSFAVFIAIILLLAVSLIFLPFAAADNSTVTITVEDAEGNLLNGVEVSYAIGGIVNSATTNENGEIVVQLPKNSSVEIKVEESTIGDIEFEGYEQAFSIEDEADSSLKIVLRQKSPAFVERTILFQDASGQRLTGRNIKVRLSCQNPLVTPNPLEVTDLDQDGSITVKEPRDCGVFQATVLEPDEFKQRSYVLSRDTQTIRLEAPDVAKGNLRARVKDSSGNIIVSTNFDVKLLDEDGVEVGEKYTQNYGEAFFTSVTSGLYSVSVEDPAGGYGIASQAGLVVTDNETTVADIVVSKTVKVRLSISIVDKATRQKIPDAAVRLVDEENSTITEKTTGDDAEDITISLTDTGNFTLFAMHDDYLYETIELENPGTEEITIEMEPITEFNSGKIEVTVVDEDDIPVKNARVKLRFLETGMLVPIEPVMTDSEGLARFRGLREGAYYAYAEKFPASGDNMAEGKEIDIREITEFTIRMVIGNSLVMVRAIDEDSELVPEAEAEFFSVNGESLGKIPLTSGEGQFELKADKKAYVVVRHPSLMPAQTMPKQLWPDEVITFEALMEPRLILGNPRVLFEGMTDMSGMPVQVLRAGNRYMALFKLSIPEEGSYSAGGFHFRVGDERLLINDPLVVKEATAGSIEAPVKSTSFTPPLGYEEDSENATEGDAKWVDVYWNDLEPMNYYFGFEIRVKSQAMPYTRLPMHYRAWAIDSSDRYIRVPEDAELGEAESVPGKQSLYAKTFDMEFLEGQAAECTDDFCYSGESMLDKDLGLFVNEPYELRNAAPHEFTFTILNNSERQYDNSELYITVGGLDITSYKIQNASAQEITASNLNTNKIEGVNLGAFTKGKSITGDMQFVPNGIGIATIEAQIIADSRIVFQRTVTASIVSEKVVTISLEPYTIPSLVPTELKISLLETETGMEVEDALVTAKVTNPDKTESFFTATTNALGMATISLPALDPDAKVTIEGQKPGYSIEPYEASVNSDVLRFNPSEVKTTMETRGQREQVITETITNMTGINLEIKDITLSGTFKGILERQTMENYAKQFAGTALAGEQAQTLHMFKIRTSENAESLTMGNETLKGEYVISITNPETGAIWDAAVPIEVMVKLSGLPDNAPCIVITKQDWSASTQGNSATLEFQVQNNCVTAGRNTPLDTMDAKLTWNSDVMGNVEISLTDSGTGKTNTETLKPEKWTSIVSGVGEDSTFYGLLTFTPMDGYLGKNARFSVSIDGGIKTETGTTYVGATPKSINSDISIINLEQCIQYPGAENTLNVAGESSLFTVDISECGNTTIDIELCKNDSECRGGSTEGGITLTPKKFTLTQDNPIQEVMVARQNIPGMYGIPVSARTPGRSYRKVGLIDVMIALDPNETFTLDKYHFTLIGTGSQDNATLTNKDLAEQVSVTASACDWGTAEEEGMFDMAGAGIGAAIAAFLGADKALASATQGAKSISAAKYGDVTKALQEANLAKQAATDAKMQADTAKNACSKANTTVKAAKTNVKAADDAAKSITATCDAGTAATTKAALGKSTQTSTTMDGTVVKGATDTLTQAKSILEKASSLTSIAGQAQTAAAATKAGDTATNPQAAISQLDKAIAEVEKAIVDTQKNIADLTQLEGQLDGVKAELATIKAEMTSAKSQQQASVQLCEAACAERAKCTSSCTGPQAPACIAACIAATPCCDKLAAAEAAGAPIDSAISTVGNSIKDTEAAKVQVHTALQKSQAALQQLQKAKAELVKAKASMSKLGSNLQTGENKVNEFNKAKFAGVLGTYAALGAIAGGLLGGAFGDDPCEQMVTAPLMDYMINLKEDMLPIDIDNPAIAGFWSVDEAKVFETYDKQEVGIYFENLGIKETDPVYSVVEFPATRHYHNNPTTIPKGTSGFGPFHVPDQTTATYTQKIHVKFITDISTSDTELLPHETYGCLQGSLLGQTGEDALPRTKLSWNWGSDTEITKEDCDFLNDEGIYCDATQMGIALTKKMQSLREFLKQNQTLPCPTNPAVTELQEIIEEYGLTLEELGLEPVQLYYPDCWMPLTTTLYDGKPALLYFVEEGESQGTVNWTSDIPDMETLKNHLHFKARLAKDGYSEDFQKDFADFYTTKSFFNAPDYFTTDDSGKWADYFEDNERLSFRQRFVKNTSLPDAGIYDVLVNIGFESGNWEFFDSFGQPNAKMIVEFLYLDRAYPNSIFYYLPLNGNVGTGTANGRTGYGIGYYNMKEPIAITAQPELVSTKEIYGSNPVAEAKVDVFKDFKTINSIASKRGFLLEIGGTSDSTRKNISFYPNYATPVVMRMESQKTDEPFEAFYEARNGSTPVETGTTMTFWTGAGQCLDYSGSPVYEAFKNKPDREANSLDAISNWQFAYATDWENAQKAGEVYLKTVLYSPISGEFKLKALQPEELMFLTPNSQEAQTVDLQGISGMQHNDGSASDIISEVRELFDLVKEGLVCITDTGEKTSFWWNPKALEETSGTRTSIKAFEDSLSAGNTCIGYSS